MALGETSTEENSAQNFLSLCQSALRKHAGSKLCLWPVTLALTQGIQGCRLPLEIVLVIDSVCSEWLSAHCLVQAPLRRVSLCGGFRFQSGGGRDPERMGQVLPCSLPFSGELPLSLEGCSSQWQCCPHSHTPFLFRCALTGLSSGAQS